MACSCHDKKAPNGWNVTKPNGSVQNVRTEVEAAAMAKRTGGTYARA